MRVLSASAAALAAALAALPLTACSTANPVEPVSWPIAVVPAADKPGRLVAVPPDCGPRSATHSKLHGNTWHEPTLGLGCSQARNFAIQVEQPRDLIAGRVGEPDAEREARAIDRYHKGEEKDLMRTSTRTSFGGK